MAGNAAPPRAIPTAAIGNIRLMIRRALIPNATNSPLEASPDVLKKPISTSGNSWNTANPSSMITIAVTTVRFRVPVIRLGCRAP